MKIDVYSKVIFTVIAVCLVLLTIKIFQPMPATAGREEIMKVNLVKIGGNYVFKSDFLKERK